MGVHCDCRSLSARSDIPVQTPIGRDRPLLILHGDGHVWLQDKPSRAGHLVRVQLEAGASTPVTETLTHAPAAPFLFERQLPDNQPAGRAP